MAANQQKAESPGDEPEFFVDRMAARLGHLIWGTAMIALEISVNGSAYKTIGFGDIGMVTAEVNWFCLHTARPGIHETLEVRGRGLVDGSTGLRWEPHQLQLGDEVTIRVIETDNCDPPEQVAIQPRP